MRRTSNQWLFLQFSRLNPGPRHWGNVGGHDNGTLCLVPLILWRRHSCRINIQQCIPEFLSTPYYLLKPKIKSFQDSWTCWSTWYFSISLNAFLNWCILPWIIERYIFKMGWSIVQIFLINSYSYNYIILIPLFFYRKSHSRRQVQHRVRDMQDRCQSKG